MISSSTRCIENFAHSKSPKEFEILILNCYLLLADDSATDSTALTGDPHGQEALFLYS